MLVGVNYFPGWWDGPKSAWLEEDEPWLPRHQSRRPLIGQFSSPETLRAEARLAARHGTDFFNFLWYGVGIQEPEYPVAEAARLGDALENFLSVADRTDLRFTIEWTNHSPWAVIDAAVWQDLIRAWLPIFAHPAYMTIGGRLPFKLHSWHYWAVHMTDRTDRQAAIGELRARVREKTGRDMFIGAGVRRLEAIPPGHPLALDRTFDFTSIYADVPNMVLGAPDEMPMGDYAYDVLESHQRAGRAWHAYDAVPFVPNVLVGFRSLCSYHADLPTFAFATPAQFAGAMRHALTDARLYPGLQFPQGSDPVGLLMVYSWNEYAEGAFLAPTEQTGMDYLYALEALRGRVG